MEDPNVVVIKLFEAKDDVESQACRERIARMIHGGWRLVVSEYPEWPLMVNFLNNPYLPDELKYSMLHHLFCNKTLYFVLRDTVADGKISPLSDQLRRLLLDSDEAAD